MTIGSKQKLSQIKKSSSVNPSFNERNDDIGFVNETKYLGIMIDDNLNWDSQIKNIQTKISRALGLLKYAERYVPISTLNDMYKQGRLPWRGYRGSCPSCPRSGGAEGASSAFKYSLLRKYYRYFVYNELLFIYNLYKNSQLSMILQPWIIEAKWTIKILKPAHLEFP